jgi:hypothetical protein
MDNLIPRVESLLVYFRAGLRVVPEWSYEHQWEAHLAELLAGKKRWKHGARMVINMDL